MRFRLSSLEPDHIDDLLLKQLEDPRMQPYFHIPIQSASEKILKRINRTYSASHLDYVVNSIRQLKQDPFLACDIITGLPSETEEDFEITRSFLKEKGFAHIHVFPFSPRPDTPLFKAKDRIPESVRDRRAAELRNLSEKLNAEYLQRQIGRENEVILETRKQGRWEGLSGNYMRLITDNVPLFAKPGDLVKVRVTATDRAEAI
jgi:threonylcarbamoyladenosine tRNA methylthiotransferase MtaB